MPLVPPVLLRRIPPTAAAGLACALTGAALAWRTTPLPPSGIVEGSTLRRIGSDSGGPLTGDERAATLVRLNHFRTTHRTAVISVLPVQIGRTPDTSHAVNLAQRMPRAGVCRACGIVRPVAFVAVRPEQDDDAFRELALEVRTYLRQNPTGADFTLYATYALTTAQDQLTAIHLVLCDAQGEWVMVDRQVLHGATSSSAPPASERDGDELVVLRLQGFLNDASIEATRADGAGGANAPVAAASPTLFRHD